MIYLKQNYLFQEIYKKLFTINIKMNKNKPNIYINDIDFTLSFSKNYF